MPKLRLAAILKRKKMSKRQFAKQLGIRYENVFRLFHSTADPRLSALIKYAAALKVKVRDLIEEDPKK